MVFSSSQEPHSGTRACKSLAVRAMAKGCILSFSIILQERGSMRSQCIPISFCAWQEKERKQLSVAKVPRSYIPRSITPPPSLPKAAKKSGQQTEDNVKSRTRASSIPRPRAVMSSPDNDQILGNRDKTRLKRPSPLKNQNTAPCRPLAQSRSSPSTITVRKPLKTTADSKETAHTSSSDKGNKGSAVDIRVSRAHIVKAKPCFTT